MVGKVVKLLNDFFFPMRTSSNTDKSNPVTRMGINSYKQLHTGGPLSQTWVAPRDLPCHQKLPMCMGPTLSNPATNCSNRYHCLLRLMKQYLISIKYGAVLANWLILQKSLCRNSNQINSDFALAQQVSTISHTFLFQCLWAREASSWLLFNKWWEVKQSSEPYFRLKNTISIALIRGSIKAFYKWKGLMPVLIYILFHTYFFHHMLQFWLCPLSQAQWLP